jgi:hypothetical protein
MLMNEFASTAFIGKNDVREKPIRGKIKEVKPGNYDKPVVEFESGEHFSLNKTNVTTLIKAYGEDSRDWVGCEIELFFGKTNFQGEPKDTVRVRPLSPERHAAPSKPEKADEKRHTDLDDEVPF